MQHEQDDEQTTGGGPSSECDLAAAMADALSEDFVFAEAEVRTFAEAGLMTSNDGLVLRFPNGAEFQLTVVQSQESSR
jgi:hypothetical protein